MEKTEEKEEIARQVILDVYNEDSSKLAFIALQFWDNYSDGSRHFRWIDACGYFGCLCIMVSWTKRKSEEKMVPGNLSLYNHVLCSENLFQIEM